VGLGVLLFGVALLLLRGPGRRQKGRGNGSASAKRWLAATAVPGEGASGPGALH
jgi:hypothetical protein